MGCHSGDTLKRVAAMGLTMTSYSELVISRAEAGICGYPGCGEHIRAFSPLDSHVIRTRYASGSIMSSSGMILRAPSLEEDDDRATDQTGGEDVGEEKPESSAKLADFRLRRAMRGVKPA